MSAEVDAVCGAVHGERNPERVNHRNGFRTRRWDTRVGSIDLRIPKLRKGSYFPATLLEPRRRSEKALLNVVAESYVLGVSTRKVDRLVEQSFSTLEPLSVAALFEAGWPGEAAQPEAARARVYVALSSLRKAGLGPCIQRRDGGWVLGVPVRLAS